MPKLLQNNAVGTSWSEVCGKADIFLINPPSFVNLQTLKNDKDTDTDYAIVTINVDRYYGNEPFLVYIE